MFDRPTLDELSVDASREIEIYAGFDQPRKKQARSAGCVQSIRCPDLAERGDKSGPFHRPVMHTLERLWPVPILKNGRAGAATP